MPGSPAIGDSGFALAEAEGEGVDDADAVASETLTEEVAAAETWKCDDSVGLMTAEDAAPCCWIPVAFSPGKLMFELGTTVGVGVGPVAALLLCCWPRCNISMIPLRQC